MNFALFYRLETMMCLHSRSPVNDSSLKFNWSRSFEGGRRKGKRREMMHGQAPYFFLRSDHDSGGINLLGVRREKNTRNSTRFCVGVQFSSPPAASPIIIPTDSKGPTPYLVRANSNLTFTRVTSESIGFCLGKQNFA